MVLQCPRRDPLALASLRRPSWDRSPPRCPMTRPCRRRSLPPDTSPFGCQRPLRFFASRSRVSRSLPYFAIHPRTAVEACAGACRAASERDEATPDAMGEAGPYRPCEALARRGGPTPCVNAGFSRGRGWRSVRSIAPAHRRASMRHIATNTHARDHKKKKPRRCAGAIYRACRRTRTCSSDRRERCGRGL